MRGCVGSVWQDSVPPAHVALELQAMKRVAPLGQRGTVEDVPVALELGQGRGVLGGQVVRAVLDLEARGVLGVKVDRPAAGCIDLQTVCASARQVVSQPGAVREGGSSAARVGACRDDWLSAVSPGRALRRAPVRRYRWRCLGLSVRQQSR